MIKERKPEIKPCERGGEDNISRDNPAKFCRLLKDGLCERAFLYRASSGFLKISSNDKGQMAFKGCQSLEETDRFNNESFMYSSKFVRRSIETEEPDNESAKKGDELAIDQRSVAPKFMGLGASLMADICANQPEDLFHTTLIRLWNDNFFEEKDRELQVTAYAMMKFHYPQYFLDKVWDGSKSSPKAKRLKAHV